MYMCFFLLKQLETKQWGVLCESHLKVRYFICFIVFFFFLHCDSQLEVRCLLHFTCDIFNSIFDLLARHLVLLVLIYLVMYNSLYILIYFLWYISIYILQTCAKQCGHLI